MMVIFGLTKHVLLYNRLDELHGFSTEELGSSTLWGTCFQTVEVNWPPVALEIVIPLLSR